MVKGPGKSSSNKNIKTSKQAPGKQNVRAACPKDMLELKFFSSPVNGYHVFFRDLLNFAFSLSVTYQACVYCSTQAYWDRAKHCNILAILCQFVTLNLFPQWQHNHIWKSDKNLHDCILHPWLAVYWNTSTIRGNKVMTKHSLSPNNFCFCFSLTKVLRDKLSSKAWKLQPKNVETLWWKTGLSYFKLLLVTPL